MKKLIRYVTQIFVFNVLIFFICLTNSHASKASENQLLPSEQNEYETIRKNFLDPKNYDLMNAVTWSLIHCADEKELTKIESILNLPGAFIDDKQLSLLVNAGGIKGFKSSTSNLLKNNDPVIRGYGAILLAVIGDHSYKKDIAVLLEDKPQSPPESYKRNFYYFDRSRAALALGLLGAKEYAPRLAEILKSSDDSDRSGAALGLGYMGAKEYADDIAQLLSVRNDSVQSASIQALAYLDAKKYSKDIAGQLKTYSGITTQETACYALVRLGAKEQSKDLAELLKDKYRKREAAKSLALLGIKEYTEDIARMIEIDDPLTRCSALVALGILGEKEYVPKIAAHLSDKESYVRSYAATALLLMNDRTNDKQVITVVRSEMKDLKIPSDDSRVVSYFRARIKMHPVVLDREIELTNQVVKAWEDLNKSSN